MMNADMFTTWGSHPFAFIHRKRYYSVPYPSTQIKCRINRDPLTVLSEIFRRWPRGVPIQPSRVCWLERELLHRNIPRDLTPTPEMGRYDVLKHADAHTLGLIMYLQESYLSDPPVVLSFNGESLVTKISSTFPVYLGS